MSAATPSASIPRRRRLVDSLLEIGRVGRGARDRELGALGAEALGHRKADAAAAAGDDRDLALEARHRTSRPRSSYTPASTIVATSLNSP